MARNAFRARQAARLGEQLAHQGVDVGYSTYKIPWTDTSFTTSVNYVDIRKRKANAAVTNAICELPVLRVLYAADSTANDRFVMRIAKHTQLKCLELTNTHVTDACVPILLSLPDLQFLDIEGAAISPDGVRMLLTGLPSGCEVVYRNETHFVRP